MAPPFTSEYFQELGVVRKGVVHAVVGTAAFFASEGGARDDERHGQNVGGFQGAASVRVREAGLKFFQVADGAL